MDLIVWQDVAHPGVRNMAIDEAIVLTASRHQCAILRFYEWATPTLSLGYFQRASDRLQQSEFRTVEFTRRLSGGGAILHDNELTYSLAIHDSNNSKAAIGNLYCAFHQAIEESFKVQGYNASTAACSLQPGEEIASNNQRFLCFERRSPVDLVLDGHKIVGSAQRRIGQTLLQHGSILLARSAFTPHLLGLLDRSSHNSRRELGVSGAKTQTATARSIQSLANFLRTDLESRLPGCVEDVFRHDVAVFRIPPALEVEIQASADDLCGGKYGNDAWRSKI